MKIEIKEVVKPIHLRDYAEVYGDETIWVWVNLPRALRLGHAEIVAEFDGVVNERKDALEALKALVESGEAPSDEDLSLDEQLVAEHAEKLEELGRRLYGWYATVWSKHDESTSWTADEVGDLVVACLDADPRLWSWIQDEHWRLINEHRDGVKKK